MVSVKAIEMPVSTDNIQLSNAFYLQLKALSKLYAGHITTSAGIKRT